MGELGDKILYNMGSLVLMRKRGRGRGGGGGGKGYFTHYSLVEIPGGVVGQICFGFVVVLRKRGNLIRYER